MARLQGRTQQKRSLGLSQTTNRLLAASEEALHLHGEEGVLGRFFPPTRPPSLPAARAHTPAVRAMWRCPRRLRAKPERQPEIKACVARGAKGAERQSSRWKLQVSQLHRGALGSSSCPVLLSQITLNSRVWPLWKKTRNQLGALGR